MVSNVMGYVTPIKEIIKIAHDHNIIVICDADRFIKSILWNISNKEAK